MQCVILDWILHQNTFFFFFGKGERVRQEGGATLKGIIKSTDKILIRSYINVHFLILIIIPQECKRLFLFWEMYVDVFRGKEASCLELTLKKIKDYYFVYIYVEKNNKQI